MKILDKLTIKHLTMNKKRTIVSIIGVVLSTALMVGIGLLFASLRDNSIKTTIASNGAQHLVIDDVKGDKLQLLKNNVEIESFSYESTIGFGKVTSENEHKPYVLVTEANKALLEELELVTGRLPNNASEIVISQHLKTNGNISYKIGDELELDLGSRKYVNEDGEVENTFKQDKFVRGEELIINTHKKYKIVGIVERTFLEKYTSPGYMVFAKNDNLDQNQASNAYITFKDLKNIYDKGENLGKNLGVSIENIHFNDGLLASYGVSRYSNVLDSMMGIIIIVLFLISVGCIVVIYNSFAISVMERKKQFGLFSSIGATKKQLRHTVFFEAFLIGIIGIPLGILGAIVGIGTVLMIVNKMLPDVFQFPLALSIYPIYIFVPVLFMIVVIILSAYLPAKRASKITPIEAIRQSDDIKIKGKKLKTNKWIKKIFGIEGEIALKNIKRNKRKYRITIISLFISIVLFISFSSLLNFGLTASNDMMDNPDYDVMLNITDNSEKQVPRLFEELQKHEEVKEITYSKNLHVETDRLDAYFTDGTKKALNGNTSSGIIMTALDTESYKKAIKDNGANYGDILYVNTSKNLVYKDGNRKVEKFDIFNDQLKELPLYKIDDTETEEDTPIRTKIGTLSSLKEAKQSPFAMEDATYIYLPTFIVSEETFNDINEKLGNENKYKNHIIYMNVPSNKNTSKYLKQLENTHSFQSFNYLNVTEVLKLQKNMMFVLSLLLYGFITLVTLIGVTSVFNTINTSIALRRKEFAMLRSMGLTPKGFNKILYFESIFFGLKSLLYALPVSIVISFLIGTQVANMVTIEAFLLPFQSIIIAVIGVFVIVLMTMMYASSKIKKENILEAIREENI